MLSYRREKMIIETIKWFVGHTSIDREEKRTSLCVHWVLSSIHHVYIVCWYLNRAQLSKRGWHFSLNVNPICYLSRVSRGLIITSLADIEIKLSIGSKRIDRVEFIKKKKENAGVSLERDKREEIQLCNLIKLLQQLDHWFRLVTIKLCSSINPLSLFLPFFCMSCRSIFI